LRTLLPVDYRELNAITFIQGPVAFAADGAIVNEHIGATFTLNEAIAFGIIEPLNGSSLAFSHYYFLQLAFFYVLSRRYRRISGHAQLRAAPDVAQAQSLPTIFYSSATPPAAERLGRFLWISTYVRNGEFAGP
jgi:hypothetical protein